MVDAGLQFGQKIILKLFHRTLSGSFDLFLVFGQLTFLQELLLCFKLIIIHSFRAEGAGLEPVCVLPARVEEFSLSSILLLYALLQTIAEVLMNDICAFQSVKLLLISGEANVFLIFNRKFILQAILHIR